MNLVLQDASDKSRSGSLVRAEIRITGKSQHQEKEVAAAETRKEEQREAWRIMQIEGNPRDPAHREMMAAGFGQTSDTEKRVPSSQSENEKMHATVRTDEDDTTTIRTDEDIRTEDESVVAKTQQLRGLMESIKRRSEMQIQRDSIQERSCW